MSQATIPLKVPQQWVERRIEQTRPELSRSAIQQLKAKRDALTQDSIRLPCVIAISYYPKRIQELGNVLGMSGDELLRSVATDLKQGISLSTTDQTTRDGRAKLRVLGTRWRMFVRPQAAEQSRSTLAVLETIQPIDIPTRQALVRPDDVRFHPIWDEIPNDPNGWLDAYQECRRQVEDRYRAERELQQQLGSMHSQRREVSRQAEKDLQRGRTDEAIACRGRIHRSVRVQFSALRVMMDLLRLRSEKECHQFAATVLPANEATELGEVGERDESRGLCLELNSEVPAGLLDEDTLVEVYTEGRSRPKRARIRSMIGQPKRLTIELDLPAEALAQGGVVELHTVSRFGMWAHKRAVHDLLDERVEGYWPDLAHLLCSPNVLEPPSAGISCERFFCDAEPGRPSLNELQRSAVAGALATRHAFCIQGPPGTGKTTVICELVQQLIAKGERILLVAPTHVAVDEVLRRIGSREAVRALRLSWDDAKVAEDVRKFTPANIIDPFLERAQNPDAGRNDRWQRERAAIGDARSRLEKLQEARKRHASLNARKQEADRVVEQVRHTLDSEEPGLRAGLAELRARAQIAEVEIHRLREEIRRAESTTESLWVRASWLAKFLGWIGFGELGRAVRQQRRLAKSLGRTESEQRNLRGQEHAGQARLDQLTNSVANAEDSARSTAVLLLEAAQTERSAQDECRHHPLIADHELQADAADRLREELRLSDKRLIGYQSLAPRFDDLVAKAKAESQDLDGLRRELLAVTNLFCCTTTGVAGSPNLRDLVFDTLIVDESSRVTDSEFLIGAVRARRWILVGDEHQLPPYVEQNDEHFVHALSALHQAGGAGKPLADAVDELGRLWEEDEELHRFRRESVLNFAERLRDSGEWESTYRAAYQTGIDYLNTQVDNPSKALLQAMRESMVHSLFERVVQTCRPAMKVRLVEQRRMVEPIAAIVSGPVYHGDYRTPPAEELARCGITPLVTPTFPTPVTFLDTSLLGIKARDELVRNSFVNRTEVRWIVEACRTLDRELAQAGTESVTVSILAFYKAQARLIRDALFHHRFVRLRFSVIDAIDRIQGQESDVVFLSFCRNAGQNVPPTFGQWLQDLRRLNVACTRAHRALIFVGQRELLAKLCSNEKAMEFYRNLSGLFENRQNVMRIVRQFGGSNR